jgi:methyl-accepting chemotaxis protein
MKRFRDLKISVKLLFGFLTVILLMCGIGYTGYRSARVISGKLDHIFENRLPSLDYLVQADRDLQQLLVAERSMIFTAADSDQFVSLVEVYEENLGQSEERFNKYKALVTTPEELAIISKYEKAREEWKEISRQVVDGRAADTRGGRRLALDLTLGVANEKFEEMRNYLDQLQEINLQAAQDEHEVAESTHKTSTLIIVVAVLFALLTGIIVAVSLSNGITKSLYKCVNFAKHIEKGDLTQELTINKNDETGQLANSLRQMLLNLRNITLNIKENADQVASSSEEISTSATQLADGAQAQASTLEETSASVEELAASVEQVSENSQSQTSAVEETTNSMDQVQNSVDEVTKTLGGVSNIAKESADKSKQGAEAVGKVVESINLISESSDKIAGIITVISDIADQTNLLALNASIEAARAGEHGRGFAVVADEVSKLADRSASSTKEIEELIKESVKNVSDGVELAHESKVSMEQITKGVQEASDMIDDLASALEQQVNAINDWTKAMQNINEMSQSIGAATEEQTVNAKQVSKAIENVNEITQQTTTSAEEMSASTEQLSNMAQQLQSLVAQFKVDEQNTGLKGMSKPKLIDRSIGNEKTDTLKTGIIEKEEMTDISLREVSPGI